MSALYDTPPTRQQLIDADNGNKAWVTDSYLSMNGIQGNSVPSYHWFNKVMNLKADMVAEGYVFKVDLIY